MSAATTIAPSPFQAKVLGVPEAFDLFLGGGRGGGKSFALALLILRHAEQHGAKCRALYLRRSYKSIADFEAILRELFGAAYGTAAKYNASEHVFRLPNGAVVELAQMDLDADYQKFQGRSFTFIAADEVGQYASSDLLDRLRSNLRSADVPTRMVLAANPGGPGHHWLAQRFVFKSPAPWVPFDEEQSGRQFVYAPSTYRDNADFVDADQYRRQLEASCPTDPELLKAWTEGDWSVARGAFFAGVLDEQRVALDAHRWTPEVFAPTAAAGVGPGRRQVVVKMNAPRRDDHWSPSFGSPPPQTDDWEVFLAYDHGSSAPAVAYLCARSPGAAGPDGRYFPRGSVLLLDEVATADPQDLNRGLGWTIPKLAEALVELSGRWGMPRAEGAADDACFAAHGHLGGSIADEFERCGVFFWRAAKGNRVAGWERMRRMLADAGSPDVPGLYVSRACGYFWATVPYLARDPRRPDDLDSRGPDHAADACRYALGAEKPRFTVAPISGL